MSGREGRIFPQLWFVRGWRLVMVCAPVAAAALVCYTVWRTRASSGSKKGPTKQASIDNVATNAPPQQQDSPGGVPATDEQQQVASPVVSSISQPDSTTKPGKAVDLSDSGFGEPSTPILAHNNTGTPSGKPHSSLSTSSIAPDTPPGPSPPASATSSSTPITECTTALRGGRARSTINLPLDVIGRFIGRQGRNIKSLMNESGAQIHVQQKNIDKGASTVPCIIQGTQAQINKALDLICMRHPEVSIPLGVAYQSPTTFTPAIAPSVSNAPPATTPEASWDYRLNPATIPTATFLAIVTYIEKLNRVWLVPYSSTQLLEDLHNRMLHAYSSETLTEQEKEEVEIVHQFVAVRVSELYWLRGRVVKKVNEEYEVQLTDYGSSVMVLRSALKPLRREHIQLAIQAFPCTLANIDPINCDGEDGMLVLQALVEGTVMDVHITATESDLPIVEMYTSSNYGAEGQAFINRELVNQGFAVWRETVSSIPVTKPTLAPPPLVAKCEEEEAPISSDTPPVSNITLSDLLPLVGPSPVDVDTSDKVQSVSELQAQEVESTKHED